MKWHITYLQDSVLSSVSEVYWDHGICSLWIRGQVYIHKHTIVYMWVVLVNKLLLFFLRLIVVFITGDHPCNKEKRKFSPLYCWKNEFHNEFEKMCILLLLNEAFYKFLLEPVDWWCVQCNCHFNDFLFPQLMIEGCVFLLADLSILSQFLLLLFCLFICFLFWGEGYWDWVPPRQAIYHTSHPCPCQPFSLYFVFKMLILPTVWLQTCDPPASTSKQQDYKGQASLSQVLWCSIATQWHSELLDLGELTPLSLRNVLFAFDNFPCSRGCFVWN
jgi:hypothetical protein